MIVVDASAIVAILMDEPERAEFIRILSGAPAVLSPVGYWEAAVNMERHRGAEGLDDLIALLALFSISVAPTTGLTAEGAVTAQRLFGKRTCAKLNLGGCFAYALAKELNAPLLFKGDDFNRTDVKSALPA